MAIFHGTQKTSRTVVIVKSHTHTAREDTHSRRGPSIRGKRKIVAPLLPAMSATAPSSSSSHADADVAASYARSGFARRMGWGATPALLLIDVCRAYWTPGSPLDCSANPAAARCPDAMRRLLAAARAAGCPVVWTAVEYCDKEMRDAGLFWLKSKSLDVFNVADTRGLADWMPGLEPAEGELVIKKKYASAFFGTSLATDLRVMGADTAVICGVSTSGCVRASALDAMQSGFRPMVVGSACGDRSDEIQKANLFDLDAKYADVVAEDEAVEHLEAGWPKAS
ncbi:putative N-carbamoylsarcosine amidase [Xylariaceae sp. FL0804]|nr:putative N-carbamoylsarcosine amidase [Xylariaceae sp. FL0804]